MLSPIFLAVALCVGSVHDGDTVRSCGGERIRLEGIDAPELRASPRCSPQSRQRLAGSKNPAWCDYEAGEASRDALTAFLRSGPVMISRTGIDRYGRTLAKLAVRGEDAGEHMIQRGAAKRWRD